MGFWSTIARVLNPNELSIEVYLYNCLLTVSGSTFLLKSIETLIPSWFDSSLISLIPSIFLSLTSSAILSFKRDLLTKHYDEIAMPTGVKKIKKFIETSKRNSFTTSDKKAVITPYKKGTPVHVKSSINHNDLLRYFGDDKKYQYISDGDKIKWIYLKNNPIGMETIAFKGHEDSPKVIKFIKDYADYEKMYEKALEKKIAMFYESLMWSLPMDKSSTIEKFFWFWEYKMIFINK